MLAMRLSLAVAWPLLALVDGDLGDASEARAVGVVVICTIRLILH